MGQKCGFFFNRGNMPNNLLRDRRKKQTTGSAFSVSYTEPSTLPRNGEGHQTLPLK